MEQLSFGLNSDPMRSDAIIEAIRPSIDAMLPAFNLSPRHISSGLLRADIGKPTERKVGISLFFSIAPSALVSADDAANKSRNGIICRVKDQVMRTYLEFPIGREQFYQKIGEVTQVGAADSFLRINLEPNPDIEVIASAVCSDIRSLLRSFPSDFACCSQYETCSLVGQCICQDQDMSIGCYYKKNLLDGKNFLLKKEDNNDDTTD